MDVLLKKDVERLGSKDEIVSVKNGYGRNYLIPKGLAVLATTSIKKMHAETEKQRALKNEKVRVIFFVLGVMLFFFNLKKE